MADTSSRDDPIVTVELGECVWPLPRAHANKIPYFKSILDGHWAEGQPNSIDLGENAQCPVTVEGLRAALKWAYDGDPVVAANSWQEVVGTAMFLGCLDEKYIAPFADLVRYEEVNVFDVVEWLTAKTEWLAAKPDESSASASHIPLVQTILQILQCRITDNDWVTRCKAVPTWILVEMLRPEEHDVWVTFSWLLLISESLKNTPAADAEKKTGEPPGKRAKRDHRCWAHEFMAHERTRHWLQIQHIYPHTCPVCSGEDRERVFYGPCIRKKQLRPLASLFPLKLESFFGRLVVELDVSGTPSHSPHPSYGCAFAPFGGWAKPIIEVVIEAPGGRYRGPPGGLLSYERIPATAASTVATVTLVK